MTSTKPLITPAMKVGELLDTFPELEPVLVDMAAPFKKLRNPVLRKTVAKVTTLQKAAVVAGVPIGELIRTLREAGGQSTADIGDEGQSVPPTETAAELPESIRNATVIETIDADELLERGEHPLARVQPLLPNLQAGQAIQIIASFRPEPLIEMLQQKEFAVHVVQADDDTLQVWITRPA
jgi:uncharacterized protein (DUF2249 family)